MEPRYTTRVMRTLAHTRKKLNKEAMRNILNEAFPKGCTSDSPLGCNIELTIVAKTGQALIANPIFDSLPSTTSKDESAMQVDSSAPTTEVGETDKEKEKEATKASSGKKYTAPLDGQSGDLIIEATAYLRLLLVLMNLDAGKVEEVSCLGLY
jgi:26S proteasome regulatory subunit N3